VIPNVTNLKSAIDVPDLIQSGTSVVAVGGSTITFPRSFFIVPYVVASAVGALRRTEVISRTKTTFFVKIFNESGVDSGGNVDYIAKGY
jgi:hypothetical protein